MNCELTKHALLDEAVPRPEGFDAHVASCETCGALAAAHGAALRLRGSTLSLSRRRPLAEVKRRAGIVGGLVLALGGLVGLLALEFSEPQPARVSVTLPGPELQPMVIAEPWPDGDLFALALLQVSVMADARREPREDATAVRVFGALPRWTAPTRTQPLRSLGSAASPVVYTSEDSP
jgi:hypothetical protein